MNRLLGWVIVALGVWLAALTYGLVGLVIGVALTALGLWFRIRPPAGLIFLAALFMGLCGPTSGPAQQPQPAAAAQLPLDAVVGSELAARAGYNAGWRGQTLVEAVAYAGIESNWRQGAVSPTGCIGLWQLCPSQSRDYDPQMNADDAYRKWAACRGGSFTCDWAPYDQGPGNPAWPADYAQAQQAVAGLPGGGA